MMVQLNFNANEHEPVSFDVMPVGDYEVVITSSEMKPTSTGGQMLVLEFQVVNGDYQNRKLWDRLNLINNSANSAKTMQIAKGTLSSICRAVGVLEPKDSAELHNKLLLAKVAVRPAHDGYDESNVIKSYKALPANPTDVDVPISPTPDQPWPS